MKKYNIIIAVIISLIYILINSYIGSQIKEIIEKCRVGYYDNVTIKGETMEPITTKAYVPPKNWTKYIIKKSFYISIPPTVELRRSNAPYTKELKKRNPYAYLNSRNYVVFQQKGLSNKSHEAYQTYCRIMIDISKENIGKDLKLTEYRNLTLEEIYTFQNLAKQNLSENAVLSQPKVRWVKIENTYGIEVEYVRKGANSSSIQVNNYYFFDDNLFATITLSYKLGDIKKWEVDFPNIIKTFKWVHKDEPHERVFYAKFAKSFC